MGHPTPLGPPALGLVFEVAAAVVSGLKGRLVEERQLNNKVMCGWVLVGWAASFIEDFSGIRGGFFSSYTSRKAVVRGREAPFYECFFTCVRAVSFD